MLCFDVNFAYFNIVLSDNAIVTLLVDWFEIRNEQRYVVFDDSPNSLWRANPLKAIEEKSLDLNC